MVRQETAEESAAVAEAAKQRQLLSQFHSALSSFTVPDERSLKRPPKGFSKCPVREIDDYFEYVTKVGKPCFKWEVIRPAFLWKLELTMSEMLCVEAESLAEGSKDTMISDDELRSQREFIMRKATQFDGTPFTFQRLCELLTTPSRHYKRTDKFLRALEKNINVVTTVTENGERVTGAEDFPAENEEDERLRGIEQPFFVKVDECDAPIGTNITAAGDARVKMENGFSSAAVKKEEPMNAEETTPVNLSTDNKISADNAQAETKMGEAMDVDPPPEPVILKDEVEENKVEKEGTKMDEGERSNGEIVEKMES